MDKLTADDARRAQVFVSRPELCTKAGLIEWVEALAADWLRLDDELNQAGGAPPLTADERELEY
jgi:hypothetical protein